MEQKQNEQAKIWGKIFSQCWTDESFKRSFIADPVAVLKEAGLEIPEGMEFKVMENSDKLTHILLPPRPDELSDNQLDSVSGGAPTCMSLNGYSF